MNENEPAMPPEQLSKYVREMRAELMLVRHVVTGLIATHPEPWLVKIFFQQICEEAMASALASSAKEERIEGFEKAMNSLIAQFDYAETLQSTFAKARQGT